MKIYKYSRDGFKTEEISGVVEIRPAISPAGYLALLLISGNTVSIPVKSIQSIQGEDVAEAEFYNSNEIIYERPVVYSPSGMDLFELEKVLLSFIGSRDSVEFKASELIPYLSEFYNPRLIGRELRKITIELIGKGFLLKCPRTPRKDGRVYILERLVKERNNEETIL